MGLDLWHVRLSAKDEHTPEFFTLEELQVFPGIVERHRHLITEVLDIECIFTIYLFPDERTKQEYEKWPGKSESTAFLIGGLPNMEEDVFKIEKANHLNGMHKFIKRSVRRTRQGKV